MKDRAWFTRASCCAALVVLLAVSGYMGAVQQRKQTAAVSVPIVFEPLEDASLVSSGEDVRSRLSMERERALLLLDSVIRDPKASEASMQDALARKAEIASNIEIEARIVKSLEEMGFHGASALCGGRMTTVVVPAALALDEKMRVQIVDAAANAAKQNADSIKIIPQKNE